MTPFQIGSTLLHKYRIDRFRRRTDGVLMYEGIDTSHARRVCIKMLERAASSDAVKCARFHDEALRANVVDIGNCDGLPYFVTADGVLTAPPPRKAPSSKPPPLPKPKPKAAPVPEIPIIVDDEAFLASAPTPPISSETILPTAFEARPRAGKRASWLVFMTITAFAGFAGWSYGRAHADVTPAAAPEPVAVQVATPPEDPTPEPTPMPMPTTRITPITPVVETVAAQPVETATAPVPAPTSKRRAPETDPLTL